MTREEKETAIRTAYEKAFPRNPKTRHRKLNLAAAIGFAKLYIITENEFNGDDRAPAPPPDIEPQTKSV